MPIRAELPVYGVDNEWMCFWDLVPGGRMWPEDVKLVLKPQDVVPPCPPCPIPFVVPESVHSEHTDLTCGSFLKMGAAGSGSSRGTT